jgi:hypothetical protein
VLDAIQDRLGIENGDGSELADLEMETKPEAVRAEIDRLQGRMPSGARAEIRKP